MILSGDRVRDMSTHTRIARRIKGLEYLYTRLMWWVTDQRTGSDRGHGVGVSGIERVAGAVHVCLPVSNPSIPNQTPSEFHLTPPSFLKMCPNLTQSLLVISHSALCPSSAPTANRPPSFLCPLRLPSSSYSGLTSPQKMVPRLHRPHGPEQPPRRLRRHIRRGSLHLCLLGRTGPRASDLPGSNVGEDRAGEGAGDVW